MRTVIFGTGRIACGVAGLAAAGGSDGDGGGDVTFVGRNASAVAALATWGRYTVELAHNAQVERHEVRGVAALSIADTAAVRRAVAGADLVLTAVGGANLAAVAAAMAPGLAARTAPLDVVALENHPDAGGALRCLLAEQVLDPEALDRLGVSGGLVARAVTTVSGGVDTPPTFHGDPAAEILVDATAASGAALALPALTPVDHFAACVQRKLFVFSAGHATAAYLGYLKGYRFVHAAVRDAEVRTAVLAAMREGQRGIAARYGEAFANGTGAPAPAPGRWKRRHLVLDDTPLTAILHRFENAAVADPVARVGRDPLRKLGPDDRILGAARLAADAGVRPVQLTRTAAAAMCFDDADDPSARRLRHDVTAEGVGGALDRHCGLGRRSDLSRSVSEAWRTLAPGFAEGNRLLTLDPPRWAWSA